jgi:hypothetical protein
MLLTRFLHAIRTYHKLLAITWAGILGSSMCSTSTAAGIQYPIVYPNLDTFILKRLRRLRPGRNGRTG